MLVLCTFSVLVLRTVAKQICTVRPAIEVVVEIEVGEMKQEVADMTGTWTHVDVLNPFIGILRALRRPDRDRGDRDRRDRDRGFGHHLHSQR